MGTLSSVDACLKITNDAMSRMALIASAFNEAAIELTTTGYIDITGTKKLAKSTIITQIFAQKTMSIVGAGLSPDYISTTLPYANPTAMPTRAPVANPTRRPNIQPTPKPTPAPVAKPTSYPTKAPVANPTKAPVSKPTSYPTKAPVANPTNAPVAKAKATPTHAPVAKPTKGKKPHSLRG
jgi:hypothetical protein